MQDILRHFLPNIDLTPEKLRALALEYSKADSSLAAVPASPASLSPFVPYRLIPVLDEDTVLHDHIQKDSCSDSKVEFEDAIFRDIFQLHHQSGCLLADSQGEFRM
jgi:hypothetical protein